MNLTAADAFGLFYTADKDVVWGSKSGYWRKTDNSLAFGEEMIVGYPFEHSIGDTIVDLARKNGRDKMLTGLEELLKPAKAAGERQEIFDEKKALRLLPP